MRKILIVEDDDFFRSAIKTFLSKQYQVLEAENGKIAQEILAQEALDLVLSDIQMPICNGIELLEWSRKFRPNTPFILMTGFSEILETQKAHDLGAKDFIPKPFKAADLLSKISALVQAENSAPGLTFEKEKDKDFCSLPVEDFLTERNTEYGIFIRVAPDKYVKISHSGGKIPPEKIKIFKDRGVHFLYVRQEDFAHIVGFTVNLSKVVNASDQVDDAKKMRFVKYTGALIVQQAFVKGADKKLFDNAKEFLGSSVSVIAENPDSINILDQLSEHTDYLYAHSLGVSIYSVMIAKKLNIHSPQTLFKLAMAGLFHNIGYKELPKDILQKMRIHLSPEERKLIESHPTRGKEILESMKGISSDIIQMTYEHHEDLVGTGYPRRIDKNKLHPLTKILSTADCFCNLTLKNPDNPNPLDGPEAIAKLFETKATLLDDKCLSAIAEIFLKENNKTS